MSRRLELSTGQLLRAGLLGLKRHWGLALLCWLARLTAILVAALPVLVLVLALAIGVSRPGYRPFPFPVEYVMGLVESPWLLHALAGLVITTVVIAALLNLLAWGGTVGVLSNDLTEQRHQRGGFLNVITGSLDRLFSLGVAAVLISLVVSISNLVLVGGGALFFVGMLSAPQWSWRIGGCAALSLALTLSVALSALSYLVVRLALVSLYVDEVGAWQALCHAAAFLWRRTTELLKLLLALALLYLGLSLVVASLTTFLTTAASMPSLPAALQSALSLAFSLVGSLLATALTVAAASAFVTLYGLDRGGLPVATARRVLPAHLA